MNGFLALGTFAEDKAGWYHVMDGEGYTYVLMANGSGNEATVTAEVPGAYAAPLGDQPVTFSEGKVIALLAPNSTLAIKITDIPEVGIYKDNIKQFRIKNGEVLAERNMLLALYQKYGDVWELLSVFKNGDVIQAVGNGEYKIKVLHWEGLSPKEDAQEWTN